MSANNGVIRVGRKGKKKFAFGEEGAPFEVDIVAAWIEWLSIDSMVREPYEDGNIPTAELHRYHQAAVEFAMKMATDGGVTAADLTPAEALDFIARLKEQYDECAVFFRPKSRDEQDSPATSAVELRFSQEPAN